MGEIKGSLDAFLAQQTRSSGQGIAPPATVKNKPEPTVSSSGVDTFVSEVGRDPRKKHLMQMVRLMKSRPGNLSDIPSAVVRSGPLSETEGEEEEEEETAGEAPGASGSATRPILRRRRSWS